jgi:hypothetical protein
MTISILSIGNPAAFEPEAASIADVRFQPVNRNDPDKPPNAFER